MADATARLLEGAEREALEDMFDAAPPGLGSAERVGGATVLIAPGLHSFFNRAFAIGIDRPVGEDDIDAILAALREASEWSVQPPPGEPELESWLAARGLERRLAWAKVLRGTEEMELKATLGKRPTGPNRSDTQNNMGSRLSSRRRIGSITVAMAS